jgi:hypothetical protein
MSCGVKKYLYRGTSEVSERYLSKIWQNEIRRVIGHKYMSVCGIVDIKILPPWRAARPKLFLRPPNFKNGGKNFISRMPQVDMYLCPVTLCASVCDVQQEVSLRYQWEMWEVTSPKNVPTPQHFLEVGVARQKWGVPQKYPVTSLHSSIKTVKAIYQGHDSMSNRGHLFHHMGSMTGHLYQCVSLWILLHFFMSRDLYVRRENLKKKCSFCEATHRIFDQKFFGGVYGPCTMMSKNARFGCWNFLFQNFWQTISRTPVGTSFICIK